MGKDKVFLDTSVIIAAVLSSTGGSFYILSQLKDDYEFCTNEYVFEETIRILDTKFSHAPEFKNRFFLLLGTSGVRVLSNPSKKTVKSFTKFINKEDAPILVSAIQSSLLLITLDDDFLEKKVIGTAGKHNLSIMKPREFILRHRNKS